MSQARVDAEIGLCLLLAAADGEISDEELAALTTRVGELLGDDFPIDRLQGLVEGELESIGELGADEYVAKLPERIPQARREEALRAACEVACADGLSAEEEDMLRDAAKVLDVDVEAVIAVIGYRETVHAGRSTHDDKPNDATRLIAERFGSAWIDPSKPLRDAGITASGFGALRLEYAAPNGHLLRVEHHTCDNSLHFHVLDGAESGPHFVLFPQGREAELVAAIVAIQDTVTPETIDARVADLAGIARAYAASEGMLREIRKSAR